MCRRYPNEYTDTAAARIASARLKYADNGSIRTDHENSGTPKGSVHSSVAPCRSAIDEAATSSKAPRSAIPQPANLATAGRRESSRAMIAPVA